MTQRVELATVMDRLAVDGIVTEYAAAVNEGDWDAYLRLFTEDGRADYRTAGGIEGTAAEVARWLARSMERFELCQHLIVNRRVRIDLLDQNPGDTAVLRADYVTPMRLAGTREEEDTAPDLVCGGRSSFGLVRTEEGWRLRQVVVEELWRRSPEHRDAPTAAT